MRSAQLATVTIVLGRYRDLSRPEFLVSAGSLPQVYTWRGSIPDSRWTLPWTRRQRAAQYLPLAIDDREAWPRLYFFNWAVTPAGRPSTAVFRPTPAEANAAEDLAGDGFCWFTAAELANKLGHQDSGDSDGDNQVELLLAAGTALAQHRASKAQAMA